MITHRLFAQDQPLSNLSIFIRPRREILWLQP